MPESIARKPRVFLFLSIAILTLAGSGCGSENFLEDFADDGSRQAKLEQAQKALDDGQCQAALDQFTGVYGSAPAEVGARMDLAAAYLCKAGFNVTTLVDIAADFGANIIGRDELFKAIADRAVETISDTWPTEIASAKQMLAQDVNASPLAPYNGNPDAGFNLSVVTTVEAVLTVVDILNFVNGVVDCLAQQGSSNFQDCQIRAEDVTGIVNGLQGASDVLADLGIASDVQDSVNTILNDIKAVDGDTADAVTCDDIKTYLGNQSIDVASVSCV